MADIEKMQAELQRLQEKQAVLKARQERQQARLNAEKRKQRNKRLIEKGAVLEDLQAQPLSQSNVCFVAFFFQHSSELVDVPDELLAPLVSLEVVVIQPAFSQYQP
ncbi:DUF3847 domain-containing protein [Limosilactobacillus reuteri]|uniref:DUF3847 domain-containing protein n=1 Tax=Limosilactobacillus reuteri TaxID=1598 RepID=UPI00214B1272|nr:DUF3847 domain-containing protein [Limosilactobacillus reuteri]MCR1863992.1 DUF3847 domain-containing protein [Limosilactobacillus reuteri]